MGFALFNGFLKRTKAAFSLFKLLNKFKCPKLHCLRIILSFVLPTTRIRLSCLVSLHLQRILGYNRSNSKRRCLGIIFNESKVPYISLFRTANLFILKERRAQIFVRFTHNGLHNPGTTSIFPSDHLPSSRARPPNSLSRKISFLVRIRVSTKR